MKVLNQQKMQQEHDLQNHFDIISRSRADRLKHYALHFAKYAGRFARGIEEKKTRAETLVDAFLVSLSAANALNQLLPNQNFRKSEPPNDLIFTDCAGRFADACEKIDHLEEFHNIAVQANADIFHWIMASAANHNLDIEALARARRADLASRAVYTAG